jgi:diguanylate cyclase (GGDEF)-like protein
MRTSRIDRRVAYACAGGLLAAGAPAGLFAVRGLRQDRDGGSPSWRGALRDATTHPGDYIYVGVSTAIVFTIFGYVLGRQAEWLAKLSETDPLTGLANARRLFERLDTELARSRRYREPLSLLLVDLDGLKSINDQFGHHAGDEAIHGLADVIRSQLRETDLAARWGGDEFAVLAPSTSKSAAVALAERIRALIPRQSAAWHLSASLGVATIDPRREEDVVDSSTLMRAADAALYEAKRTGRNRVVVARPGSAHDARSWSQRGL